MSPLTRKLLLVLRVALGVALLYYVIVYRGEWRAFDDFITAGWLFPALVLLAVFGAAIEVWRLAQLCRSQDITLTFGTGYRLVTMSAFFNVCIPAGGTGGDVIKLWYLAKSNRGRGVEAATVLLVDRALGLFTLLLVGSGLALINMDVVREQPVIQALLAVAVLGMLALLVGFLLGTSTAVVRSGWFTRLLGVLPLHRQLKRVIEALYAFRTARGVLLRAVLLSFVGHAALAAMFVASSTVLLEGVPGRTASFLSLLGMLANALPLTPGGIGVGEAAFAGLFGLLGVDGGARLMLAWRAGTLPLLVLGGILYMAHGAGPVRQAVKEEGRA